MKKFGIFKRQDGVCSQKTGSKSPLQIRCMDGVRVSILARRELGALDSLDVLGGVALVLVLLEDGKESVDIGLLGLLLGQALVLVPGLPLVLAGEVCKVKRKQCVSEAIDVKARPDLLWESEEKSHLPNMPGFLVLQSPMVACLYLLNAHTREPIVKT